MHKLLFTIKIYTICYIVSLSKPTQARHCNTLQTESRLRMNYDVFKSKCRQCCHVKKINKKEEFRNLNLSQAFSHHVKLLTQKKTTSLFMMLIYDVNVIYV
jgi:hypothetical protein